jgi:hypothetical protein
MPETHHLQRARELLAHAAAAHQEGGFTRAADLACVADSHIRLHNAEQATRRDALVRDTLTKVFLLIDPEAFNRTPQRPAVAVCDNPECALELAHAGTDQEGDPLGAGQFAGTCPACKGSMRIKDSEAEA